MSAIILTTQTTTPLSTAQISGTDGATSSSSAQPQVSAWSLFGQNKATARQNKGNLIDIFDLPTTSTYEDVIGYFRDEFGISDSNIPQAIPYWSNYIAKIKSDPLSNIASDLDQLATLLQIIPGINNQKTSGLLNGTGFDVSDLTEELQAQANTLNIFEFMKFCSEQIGVLNEQRLKQKVKNADITYKQVDNINKEMIKQNKDRIEKETETLKKQDEQKNHWYYIRSLWNHWINPCNNMYSWFWCFCCGCNYLYSWRHLRYNININISCCAIWHR